MRKRMNSKYWWKQFVRIEQAQKCFDSNSTEYIKLNKVGWEVISKYIEELEKEFMK